MQNLIGHQKITEYFEQALKNDKLAHCYIFSGSKQVGKTTFLNSIVAKLLKLGEANFDLQNRQQLSARCPDFYFLQLNEEKSEISVEQVRILKQQMSLGSFLGGYKVAVIFDADLLNQSASNALLKLLEEPAPNTVLFLLAESADNLLATISSRAVKLNFSPVPVKEIEKGLIERGAGKDQAAFLSLVACGRPGKALEYLNDADKFDTMKSQALDFILALSKPRFEQFAFLQSGLKKGESDSVLEIWQLVLRDLLLLSSGTEEGVIFSEYLPQLRKLNGRIGRNAAQAVLEDIQKLPSAMKFHINQTNYLENSFLNL